MLQSKMDKIPVVIALTPNYFVPAAALLKSLLDSAGNDRCFQLICLLSEGLKQEQETALRALVAGKADIEFVDLAGRIRDIYIHPVFTEAASYRLLLPELLVTYDKVLYLDCDMIIRNDMAALYESVDLGDHYLAAVFEAVLDFQESYIRSLWTGPMTYFNSGVLLMNLKKMREDGLVPKLLEASANPELQFPDQDVLNQFCRGRTIALEPQYNAIRTFFLPQYKKDFLKHYSAGDWTRVQQHGNLHYTGAKPWNVFTVHFEEWWKVYESLPADIRQYGRENRKMYWLYRLYRTGLGRRAIDQFRGLYRTVKYGRAA